MIAGLYFAVCDPLAAGPPWADIEPLTRHPERQGCRAALYPGEDFGSVTTPEQVRQGAGENGGGEGSHIGIVPRSARAAFANPFANPRVITRRYWTARRAG